MKNQSLYDLFVEELADAYSFEQQIVESLPKLIRLASLPELKEAIKTHLEETEEQVTRIKKIFSILHISIEDKTCEAMEGLLKEAEEITENFSKSPTLDAAIIGALQKVEHYEIASYGTLRSFAKHLDLGREVIDLLQTSLNEEGAADKKLTKIADGSFFSSGVNKEAASVGGQNGKRGNNRF